MFAVHHKVPNTWEHSPQIYKCHHNDNAVRVHRINTAELCGTGATHHLTPLKDRRLNTADDMATPKRAISIPWITLLLSFISLRYQHQFRTSLLLPEELNERALQPLRKNQTILLNAEGDFFFEEKRPDNVQLSDSCLPRESPI